MDWNRFVLISLATWAIAFMVSNTSGPFHAFEWVRNHLPLGGLTSCIICLSPWIAVALWLLPDGIVIWALAAAGLALMLHSYVGWRFNN